MKKTLLLSTIVLLTLSVVHSADASSRKVVVHKTKVTHVERRTRDIYVIRNHRPVRQVVFIDDGGAYYNVIGGRRVYIRERYYTSYPSRYYYDDGRPRVGVTLRF